MSDAVTLEVRSLDVVYPARRGQPAVRAVSDVSFDLRKGETLALVGESGCGKSTLAKAILRLGPITKGSATLRANDASWPLHDLEGRALRRARRHFQVVFQDPLASLDPRWTAQDSIEEALRAHRLPRRGRAAQLLEDVGLDRALAERFPHQVSGGQRQRITLARALAPDPDLLILDEAVSALDVSLRAQVINLLARLQRERELAMLFITHDLAVVRALAHRVAVMYLGRLVEIAPRETLLESPRHPYTRALLDAAPLPDPEAERARRAEHRPLAGEPPRPTEDLAGCAFASRCPIVEARCHSELPPLRSRGDGIEVRCHLA